MIGAFGRRPSGKPAIDPTNEHGERGILLRLIAAIVGPAGQLQNVEGVLEGLVQKGVLVRYLTLHVGVGTFLPIRSDEVEEHRMEPERFEMPRALVLEINALPGRLITVGTTATRAVEGYFSGNYEPRGEDDEMVRGSTDIFIHPGHEFCAVEGLLTNFHLPRSTPLMLASAFCGRERLLDAYAAAVESQYRFFSYGDAMLLLKGI